MNAFCLKFVVVVTTIGLSIAHASASANETDGAAHTYSQNGEQLDCTLGYESLKKQLLGREGVELLSENAEFVAYEWRQQNAVMSVTKEGHYAHPMIIVRKVVQEGGVISVHTLACGYNTKSNSDRLMREFKALDNQIREDLQEGQ